MHVKCFVNWKSYFLVNRTQAQASRSFLKLCASDSWLPWLPLFWFYRSAALLYLWMQCSPASPALLADCKQTEGRDGFMSIFVFTWLSRTFGTKKMMGGCLPNWSTLRLRAERVETAGQRRAGLQSPAQLSPAPLGCSHLDGT